MKSSNRAKLWNEMELPYTDEDVQAYNDTKRVNDHFGLPLPYRERTFLIRISADGLMTRGPDHSPRVSSKGKNVLDGNFGNLVAYRHLKRLYPDAWIWAERYTFTDQPAIRAAVPDQKAFIELLGKERLTQVEKKAKDWKLDPGGKTNGRPDLAVCVPTQTPSWKFIELKKKGKDRLSDEQKQWLELIVGIFGKDSAVEASLVFTKAA